MQVIRAKETVWITTTTKHRKRILHYVYSEFCINGRENDTHSAQIH